MAKTRYPEQIQLDCEHGLNAALDQLALLTRLSKAAAIRQCLWREVHRHGLDQPVDLDQPVAGPGDERRVQT
jgi:hypothetical protein